nr:hypothetical protein [Pandoravirus massiliensis]
MTKLWCLAFLNKCFSLFCFDTFCLDRLFLPMCGTFVAVCRLFLVLLFFDTRSEMHEKGSHRGNKKSMFDLFFLHANARRHFCDRGAPAKRPLLLGHLQAERASNGGFGASSLSLFFLSLKKKGRGAAQKARENHQSGSWGRRTLGTRARNRLATRGSKRWGSMRSTASCTSAVPYRAQR